MIGTLSDTASQIPATIANDRREQQQAQSRVDGELLHEIRVVADHPGPTLEAC